MDGMKCNTAVELATYLRNLCKVEGLSVDRIIVGDPNVVIQKVGTCWLPYFNILQQAYDVGVNVLVCHEPTFYAHFDLEKTEDCEYKKHYISNGETTALQAYSSMVEKKKQWILEHGMTIIRCHDVLDALPDFGVPFALGKILGFRKDDLIRSRKYVNVYRTTPTTAGLAAKYIAKQLHTIGQAGVAFYGNPERTVKSIALGTGCFRDPLDMMELSADLYITIDDSIHTWVQPVFAADSGMPLVVINHGTSEEPGMQRLCEHLQTVLEQPVEHFFCGCGYNWVTGE